MTDCVAETAQRGVNLMQHARSHYQQVILTLLDPLELNFQDDL